MQSACDPAVSTLPDISTQKGDSNACPQSSTTLLQNSNSEAVSAGLATAADLLPDPSYDPWDLTHTLVPPESADNTPSIPSDLPTVLTK